jgi:hypothetical protein
MSGKSAGNSSEEHMKNFLHCIKTREEPNCTVENGRLVAQYSHIGNIAQRTGSRLVWDDARKKFEKNTAASSLIRPEYRKPWSFPQV